MNKDLSMKEEQKKSAALNIMLWTAQFILAAGFVWAAFMKLFQPIDKLTGMWPWTADHTGLVTLTGILDLLAGLGLVLPGLLRMQPALTIYAAYGTILLMVVAGIFHISRGEASQIGINVFFFVLAVFVASGQKKI